MATSKGFHSQQLSTPIDRHIFGTLMDFMRQNGERQEPKLKEPEAAIRVLGGSGIAGSSRVDFRGKLV